MAALTSAGVTVHDVYKTGGTNGRRLKVVEVTLTLSSQGGLTNNIPSSLFGLTRITRAWGFRDTSSVKKDFGPNLSSSLVGTLLVAYNDAQATDANRNDPADITATVRGFIEGYDN